LAADRPGTVGRPLPGIDVQIEPDGEILVRGGNVMLGYYQDDAATAEVLRDGWLMTGDLGSVDDDGFLRITGRKKEIIVTLGGKNIVPTQLEALLAASPFIAQAMIVGDQRPYLTALIVPNWGTVVPELGISDQGDRQALASHEGVRELIRTAV